ncbi:MAG: hypothetical protein KBT48_02745 [Firmicutes bacterium]|nr:hypothetical protein [Bacillota bacterium]
MIDEKHLNIYSAKPIPLLKPYFYLFYTGNQEVKDEICLSEEFFKHCSEKLGVEIRAKVIKDLNKREHISTQYILFTKIFDEQRSLYGYSMKTIEETLRICKTKGILLNYLETRESEVIEFMSFFLDQEKAMEFLIEEKQAVAKEEGIGIGINRGIGIGINQGIDIGKTQEKESRIQSIANTLFQQNNSIDSCIEQLKAFFPDVDLNTIQDIVKKVYNS